MALIKNFSYGELWDGIPLTDPLSGHRLEEVDPETLTNNRMFLDWLDTNSFKVYLDHSGFSSGRGGMPGVAVTRVEERKIIINANYSPNTISNLLQHEMGHLVLFNCSQFTTIRKDNFRSIIAKVIYTPKHVTKFGMHQLLLVENIVQDVIIETLSGSKCVCSTTLSEHGVNLGVKHLTSLEDVRHIAREVCENLLVEEEKVTLEELPDEALQAILEVLKAMLEELSRDTSELEEEKKKALDSSVFFKKEQAKARSSELKKQRQKEKLQKRLEGLKEDHPLRESIEDALQRLEKAMAEERPTLEEMEEAAEAAQKKALERVERLLAKNKDLREALEGEEEAASDALEGAGSGTESSGVGSSGKNGGEEEGPAAGAGEGDGGEASAGSQGAESSGSGAHQDNDIQANTTDHLSDGGESNPENSAHSYDCGYPLPLSVTRDESEAHARYMKRINGRVSTRKIIVKDDEGEDYRGGKMKSTDRESTYFKPSKKEFDPSDMLRGRVRLKTSGVGVLVGLDISGSMSGAWVHMFKELSEFVEDLSESLDIADIQFFTYHTKVVESSRELEDLTLRAGGGNAFPYVYQDMMQKLSIRTRNEIILVTDCGDNLGFALNKVCEGQRNGETVINHVSVVDTEGAAFSHLENIAEEDWTFYHYSDGRLKDAIRENIQNLIDRV